MSGMQSDPTSETSRGLPWWKRPLYFGAMIALAPVMAFILHWPEQLQSEWCPSLTFHHEDITSGLQILVALTGGFSSVSGLTLLLLSRVDLSAWSGGYGAPKPRSRYFFVFIYTYLLIFVVSGCFFMNIAHSYYCLTPSEIITRTGYFDPPRKYSWQDVKTVYAWCWTEKTKYVGPYLGGSIMLALADGTKVRVTLSWHEQTSLPVYKAIRAALRGKTYQYFVNSTVTEKSCPAELYELLWFWPSNPD